MHEREVFVDGGSHHANTMMRFVHTVKGKFYRIIAIEPDKANRAGYAHGVKQLTVLDCALTEHAGIAKFHDGLGYASQLSDTGHKYVTTYPLDFLKTKPTFVKLHLEGAELAALKGAQRTLVEYRPIIAVTTYHNEDGVWKIPVYLMGLLEKYKFLFRVHSWCGTGAVMYAIPKERYA
jgi:FkbM family methyltransferase